MPGLRGGTDGGCADHRQRLTSTEATPDDKPGVVLRRGQVEGVACAATHRFGLEMTWDLCQDSCNAFPVPLHPPVSREGAFITQQSDPRPRVVWGSLCCRRSQRLSLTRADNDTARPCSRSLPFRVERGRALQRDTAATPGLACRQHLPGLLNDGVRGREFAARCVGSRGEYER